MASTSLRVRPRSFGRLAVAPAVYPPLAVLLLAGLVLRVVTMALYFPTALQWIDAVRFSRIGGWHGLFSDYYMPAGYAAFLKVTHAISRDVALTIGIQHLLGLAGGALAYYAVRRAGGPLWLGIVPAAVLVLGGDQLYLEHLLMNDFLFMFLMAAGLCAGMFGLLPVPRPRVLALASAILAIAGLTRQTGLAAPVVLSLCALLAGGGSPRRRLVNVAAALGPAVVVVLAYVGIANAFGPYTGLTDMGGWNLYARAAPFADCHDFSPPAGTSRLCEASSPGSRNGPFWYAWEPQSRGQAVFGVASSRNARLPLEFAQAAIEHQPLDYLSAVAKDMVRYADPLVGTVRNWSGDMPQTVSFEQGVVDPGTARHLEQVMGAYWSDLTPHLHDVAVLDTYQSATRIEGVLWWLLWALALLGLAVGRGPVRIGCLLFGLTAFSVYLLPTMTLSWDWRYGIPPQFELVAAATLGGWAVWQRARRRSPPAASGG